MKNIDRRQWLKAAGLSSSFTFLGGLSTMAMELPLNSKNLYNSVAKLNSNENPFGPSKTVRKKITEVKQQQKRRAGVDKENTKSKE